MSDDASKEAKKAAREQERQAKQAEAEAKAQAREAEAQARREAKQAETDAKLARYKQLRANVRRRRFLYVLFILLAIGVFAASVWDILYNDSDFMLYVLVTYAVLFVWGLLLLLSRHKHLEEVEQMWDLERVYLEDPETGEVFQLGASQMPGLVGAEFTSPVTGKPHRMPKLDAPQVERVLPEGEARTQRFAFEGVKGEVATFGHDPKAVTFRRPPA